MKPLSPHQRGITLVEVLVVTGIVAILFSIAVAGIMNMRITTTNNTTASVIISDLKNQQIQAMTGDTEGRGTPDNYGIKVLPTSYVLFHGDVYNPSESSNFSVPTDQGYQLSSTFPDNIILFASKSGEIVNFTPGQNTITLTNTSTNASRTIELNTYGTVIDIN